MDAPQNKEDIVGYLKQFIAAYKWFAQENGREDNDPMTKYYQLMLDKGEWFVGRKLARTYETSKAYKRAKRPQIKQCFYNSQMFCHWCDGGAKYYEGFMCDSLMAVQHGWVVMSDGNVVDFTLEARDAFHKKEGTKLEKPTEPVAYLGVEVPYEFLMKKIAETKMCQPYAHCYYLGATQYFID